MRPLLAAAAIAIVIAAARFAAPVIAPICLAAVLAIAFEPVTEGLARRGVPRWVAAATTTLGVLAVVGGFALLVVRAAADLAGELPRYADRLAALEHDAGAWLRAHGLDRVARSVETADAGTRLEAAAEPLVWGTVQMLQTLLLVVVTTAFIQIDAPGIRAAVRRRVRNPDRSRAIDGALDEIQRYVIVKGLLSIANGLLLGTWCAIWGIDGALLWGVLAFGLNFVPVVGSLIAAGPPFLLALVTGGPEAALGVAAGYVAVNLVVDNMIEPKVMGRACGVSALVVVLGMLVWGLVLGPIGALLSVPLTVAVKAFLQSHAELRWVAVLLEDPPRDDAYSAGASSSRRYSERRSIPSTRAA